VSIFYGALGIGSSDRFLVKTTIVPVHDGEMSTTSGKLENIIAISGGTFHVLALDKFGNVWAWGYNEYGQLGNGEHGYGKEKTTPVRVKKIGPVKGYLTDIVYVDAGFEHSTAIDKNGNFWVWGYNEYGQLGLGEGDTDDRCYAEQMP